MAGCRTDRRQAVCRFAALVYLTSDALVYHGWLAYTDPLFAFFIFGAIACLWVATTRRSIALVWTAAAAVSCAALTKGQTAYVFYAVAALVLLRRRELRAFLLRPGVLVPQFAAAALYFVWHQQLTGGAQQDTDLRMILENARVRSSALTCISCVVSAGNGPALRACQCARRVFLATQETGRARGATLRRFGRDLRVDRVHQLSSVLALAVHGQPLRHAAYPLAAYLIAHMLWRQSAARKRWVVNCLIATIAFKYVAALWVYPAYQREYRGDSRAWGRDRRADRGTPSTRPMCRRRA